MEVAAGVEATGLVGSVVVPPDGLGFGVTGFGAKGSAETSMFLGTS